MTSFSLISLFILSLLSFLRSENPSFAINITEQAVINIKNHVLPEAISKLLSLPLPDIEQEKWPFTITITQLTIRELVLNASDIAIDLVKNQISLEVQHVAVNVDGNLEMNSSLITNTGVLKVALSEITVGLSISISLDETYKFQVALSNINVNIGNFQLSIDGSFFIDFINLFISLFEGVIRNQVQSQIEQALQNQAPAFINDLLAKIPTDVKLPYPIVPLALNIQPFSNPIINDNSIKIELLGFVYDYLFNKQTPPIPGPLPFTINSSQKQIQIIISDYIINSAFYSLVEADVMSYIFINIPGTNYTLNTDVIDYFLPGFAQEYGSNKLVIFYCSIPVPPKLDFKHPLYDINLEVNVSCEILPVLDYKPINSAQLTLTLNISLNAEILNDTISVNFTQGTCEKLEIINTNFTKIEHLEYLQDTINLGLEFGLKAIEPTVKIPEFQGIRFNDSSLEFGDGFISIETSPDFTNWIPPTVSTFSNFFNGFKWVNFLEVEEIYKTFLNFNASY